MKITYDMRHVANYLKKIVNASCEEGFVWFEEVGDMPSLFEILRAIKHLDEIGDEGALTISEDDE